jgi:hypothetical protein
MSKLLSLIKKASGEFDLLEAKLLGLGSVASFPIDESDPEKGTRQAQVIATDKGSYWVNTLGIVAPEKAIFGAKVSLHLAGYKNKQGKDVAYVSSAVFH